jgi:hypothetical protein
MNPNSAFSLSLLVSLVLWLPSVLASLRGDLDMTAAGLRYLAALTLSRFAVGGVARLLSAYRSVSSGLPPAEIPSQAETPRRRKEDHEEADAA